MKCGIVKFRLEANADSLYQDTPATVWNMYVCTYCTSISNVHSPSCSVTSTEDAQGVGVGVLVAVDVEVTVVSVSIENNTIK